MHLRLSVHHIILSICTASMALAGSADKEGKSPLDDLPSYIRQVTPFGQRADFSHDGKRILFLERSSHNSSVPAIDVNCEIHVGRRRLFCDWSPCLDVPDLDTISPSDGGQILAVRTDGDIPDPL